MDWVLIKDYSYKGTSGSGVKAALEYNDATATPTALEVRFRGHGSSYKNGHYILWDPGADNERIFTIDPPSGKLQTTNFIISKAYDDASFKIPALWFCNTGSVKPDITARTIEYDDYEGSVYNCFKPKGKRSGYVTRYTALEKAILPETTVATQVTAGKVSIEDNFNNTFTITATKGTSGANNKAGGPQALKFGYSSTARNTTYTSGTAIALIPSGNSDTRRVYAEATTTATYGPSKKATAEQDIRQYIVPMPPTDLKINTSKNRFTVKENWSLEWTAAEAANNYSNVVGYRIRLYRERGNTVTKLHIKNNKGTNLSIANGNDIFYDRDSTSTTLTIYPALYGNDLQPGHKVKFSVIAYTKYGENNDGEKLFNTTSGAEVYSSGQTILNAGIVRVKVPKGNSSTWTEGQVWVKVPTSANDKVGRWVEAEVVKTKTSSGWVESE